MAIFDEAITFLRIQPGLLLGIALIVLVPLRLIAVAMPGSPLRDARPDQLIDIFVGNLSQPGAVTAAFITLILESVALFTVASIYGELVASWYSGRAVTAGDLLVASIKRSPVIVAAWLIVHALEFGGALFTVGIGGLIIGVFLMVTAPIVGAETLARSSRSGEAQVSCRPRSDIVSRSTPLLDQGTDHASGHRVRAVISRARAAAASALAHRWCRRPVSNRRCDGFCRPRRRPCCISIFEFVERESISTWRCLGPIRGQSRKRLRRRRTRADFSG